MSHTPALYHKPAQTPGDLLYHLQTRGLYIHDQASALYALEHVGYYRLLIYMRPLQDLPGKNFRPGVSFEDILQLYNFDRELRLLCLNSIERIEVALRAAIINELSVAHGPHFYLDAIHFEKIDAFRDFLDKASKARYLAISHYHQRYNTPPLAPIWAICEAITFGALSHLYSGLHIKNRKLVARQFGFDESILVSWFRTLNDLRNACAHHNRTWNSRTFVNQPKSANLLAAELTPDLQPTFYARAAILIALLKQVDRKFPWKESLIDLLNIYPAVPESAMGFPAGWRNRSLWT